MRRRVTEYKNSARNLIRLPLGGFPKTNVVRLKYVAEKSLNASTVGFASTTFSANGLYDPDITGTGHQPSNFSSWINLYDHYRVLSSKCTVTFLPEITRHSGTNTAMIGVLKSDTGNRIASLTGGLEDMLEQPGVRYSTMTAGHQNAIPPKVTSYYSAKKFFGSGNHGKQEGDVANNPSDGAFWEVWAHSVAGGDPPPYTVLVEIEYIVKFTERKYSYYS